MFSESFRTFVFAIAVCLILPSGSAIVNTWKTIQRQAIELPVEQKTTQAAIEEPPVETKVIMQFLIKCSDKVQVIYSAEKALPMDEVCPDETEPKIIIVKTKQKKKVG